MQDCAGQATIRDLDTGCCQTRKNRVLNNHGVVVIGFELVLGGVLLGAFLDPAQCLNLPCLIRLGVRREVGVHLITQPDVEVGDQLIQDIVTGDVVPCHTKYGSDLSVIGGQGNLGAFTQKVKHGAAERPGLRTAQHFR